MGIQINGNTDNISAVDGDLSITGITTFSQLDVGNNIKLGNAGVITATSFVGSGANLTNLPTQVTITGNADDRVITGGSGVNLNGESNMTYTSNLLKLSTSSSTSTDAELLHLVGGGTATRGLKIGTGRASGASQNHAAAIYDAIDSESNAYGAQHRFKIAGTDCFTIGYNGDKGFVGINDSVPYPDSVSGNTVNTCLELGSPSGTDTASVIKFVGRDGSGNGNKCQIQWAGANNRFDITVNGNQALQIQPNKDVEITDGDLVIGTSGHGISFSAAGNVGGMTSELLDDYEEGSWTPTATTSAGGSYNSSYVRGTYIKVGRKVSAWFNFEKYSNQGTDMYGSNSGAQVFFGGLPYASANGTHVFYHGDMAAWAINYPSSPGNLATAVGDIYAFQNSNSTVVEPYYTGDNASGTPMNSGAFGQAYIRGCIHYFTT